MSYPMKKGINIWSFNPKRSIAYCLKQAKDAGFDGVELVLAANGSGEIAMDTPEADILAIRRQAEEIGIEINAVATGLYWIYSFTSDRADIREKAMAVARRQIDVAKLLGADAVLICPGGVGVDFKPEDVVPDAENAEFFTGSEVIEYDVAYDRAKRALIELSAYAAEKQIHAGVENIWNKFLLSPLEMRNFIDEIGSPWVGAWVDVANMLMYGYPEHWIKILGSRIVRVHFKDFRCAVKSLDGFVDLLAGDVNWRAVMDMLEKVGYRGYCNAEMCPTYKQYTDQMVYNCSAAMDCIFQRRQYEEA